MEISTDVIAFLDAIGFFILKEPAKEIGSLITDQFKLWRFKNIHRIVEKAKRYCERKGINPKSLSKAFVIPFIESAQNEDAESLQDMWAALLGNAVIGEAVHPAYIDIIRGLTGIEVKLLTILYNEYKKTGNRYIDKHHYELMIHAQLNNTSISNSLTMKNNVVIGNLNRLGLVRMTTSKEGPIKPKAALTTFATDFISACTYIE